LVKKQDHTLSDPGKSFIAPPCFTKYFSINSPFGFRALVCIKKTSHGSSATIGSMPSLKFFTGWVI
jgi:hypothetical protein